MILFASIFQVLLAVISLDGVTGEKLRARAYFDTNRVRVGDPLILSVDFIGKADFAALHPPAISREVDATVFRVDDISAKTDTYSDARRLTYRVRTVKPGTHEFPALTFSYTDRRTGRLREVSTGPVPVRVRAWAQAALTGLDEDANGGRPCPDGLILKYPGVAGGDGAFAWRRACRAAKADSFREFDFPAARLNEAACAIMEGNWGRAQRLYSSLEWQIGQTPAIERGLIAALALKTDGAVEELPVWRQVGRPVLRYAWPGRVALVLGTLLALALLFFLIGKGIRRLAAVAILVSAGVLPLGAANRLSGIGQRDPFYEMRKMQEQMERQMRQMRQQMQQATTMTIGGERPEQVDVRAWFVPSRKEPHVGEPFDFIISLELPRTASVEGLRLTPSNAFGLRQTARPSQLADGTTTNAANVVRRFLMPVRYDVPIRQELAFTISGMITSAQSSGRGGGFFNFSFSRSFEVATEPLLLDIKPLSTDGQPKDFNGAVGSSFRLQVRYDHLDVVPDDVVTGTCTLRCDGFLPEGCLPVFDPADGVKIYPPFEMGRDDGILQLKFFLTVAEAARATPRISLRFYDPDTKAYQLVESAPQLLRHVPEAEPEGSKVVSVNANQGTEKEAWKLRFTPSEQAATVAVRTRVPQPRITETSGVWVRIELDDAAGWVKKDELK